MSDSLREQLENAFDTVEQGGSIEETEQDLDVSDSSDAISDDVNDVEVPADESDRERDERGRFKAKDTVVEETPQAEQAEEGAPESLPDPEVEDLLAKKPASFESKAVWQKLVRGQANEEDQKCLVEYYLHREKDFHNGLQHYKSEAEKSHYLADSIAPYVPILQQQNLDPGQFVKNLANTHYLLSTGSMEQRVAVLHEAAKQYGIHLVQTEQGLALAPMSHNDQLITQQMQEYRREIDAIKQWRETETRSNIQSEINRLVADKNSFPHFEDLREDMALLLESGHATTFEQAYAEAYRRATRFTPRAPTAPQSNPQRIAKAKATAVSPKSGTPTVPPSSNYRQSLRASLEDAFEKHS